MAYPSQARQAVVLAITETTPGTYETGIAAANDAILIGSDLNVRPTIGKIDRGILKQYLNPGESISGFNFVEVSFSVEVAGAGTVDSAPRWSRLLRACGFSTASTVGVKTDSTPVSESFQSLSMSVFYAGIRRNFAGMRGSQVEIDLSVNTVPKFRFTFVGIERAAPNDLVVATLPTSPDFSVWKQPVGISDATAGPITLGSAYNASTGAITGGTGYASKGMRITVTNEVSARPFLGWSGDNTPITGRSVSAQISFDLSPANREAFWDACKANTLQSMSQVITSPAPWIVKFFMPAAELVSLVDEDDGGLALDQWTFAVRPSVGNDELRIVTM